MSEQHHKFVLPDPPETIRTLTKEEFGAKLRELGVSQSWLGAWIGCGRFLVNRWHRGANPVPRWLTFLIYLLERERANLEVERPGDPLALAKELPAPRPASADG